MGTWRSALSELLGRTAGANGWTRALWGVSKTRWRLQGADASQKASGGARVGAGGGGPGSCPYLPAVAAESSSRLLAHARCLGSTWGHFQ